MGIMRMVSAIEVSWVSDLIPKLKDQVDIERLNSRQQSIKLEDLEAEIRMQPNPEPKQAESGGEVAEVLKEEKLK